jgi:hypothetical protein
MPDFSLKKWYMDIADDKGDVYIGYWVTLKWGKFGFNAFQHFWRTPEKGIEAQTEIIRHKPPEFTAENQLIWQASNVKAVWQSGDKPILETLVNTEYGKIIWHCTQPRAQAAVKSTSFEFAGWGYSECIDITIPLWKLPFTTLYWGRAHSQNHYMVWIKLEGQTNLSLIWLDGQRSHDFVIQDSGISGTGFQLKSGENVSLRQGRIASTIFQPFKKIRKALPSSVFLADENKWYNQATLYIDSSAEPATVIYEKVMW